MNDFLFSAIKIKVPQRMQVMEAQAIDEAISL
jgi:hypothetical protein